MTHTKLDKTTYTQEPWTYEYGAVHAGSKGRILLADRENPSTTPCERDRNVQLASAAQDLLNAAKDAVESLRRLPDLDGAYRITCLSQLEAAIAKAESDN